MSFSMKLKVASFLKLFISLIEGLVREFSSKEELYLEAINILFPNNKLLDEVYKPVYAAIFKQLKLEKDFFKIEKLFDSPLVFRLWQLS
jgi:hypothetical protein